ncbi:MAG: hypothetical protein I8H91_06400 [Burkholderiales bacterium]|nr:hypothetical protein [Burkholderiales bacterium]
MLRDAGVAFRQINADEMRQVEPAISRDTGLLDGVHLPDDEVANCRQFALLPKEQARLLGAEWWQRTRPGQPDGRKAGGN